MVRRPCTEGSLQPGVALLKNCPFLYVCKGARRGCRSPARRSGWNGVHRGSEASGSGQRDNLRGCRPGTLPGYRVPLRYFVADFNLETGRTSVNPGGAKMSHFHSLRRSQGAGPAGPGAAPAGRRPVTAPATRRARPAERGAGLRPARGGGRPGESPGIVPRGGRHRRARGGPLMPPPRDTHKDGRPSFTTRGDGEQGARSPAVSALQRFAPFFRERPGPAVTYCWLFLRA